MTTTVQPIRITRVPRNIALPSSGPLRSDSGRSATAVCGKRNVIRQSLGAKNETELGERSLHPSFKELEVMHDWRVKQMKDMCQQYFIDLFTKGDEQAADMLLDDQFELRDHVWAPNDLVVGPHKLKELVKMMRTAYPDLWFEVHQVGVCDTNRLFVQFSGEGTNLGSYHGRKPSHHASTFSGVGFFTFNHDRSKMVSVDMYRTPFAEDRHEVGEAELDHNSLHELHLARLHKDSGRRLHKS